MMLNKCCMLVIVSLASLLLCGCGNPIQSDNLQSSGSAETVTNEKDAHLAEAEEVKSYLESIEAAYPMLMWSELGDLLDAVGEHDSTLASDLKESISDRAYAVIIDDKVPLAASDLHAIMIDICSGIQESAGYLYLASFGTSDAADYIDKAADLLSDIDTGFEEMADEINSLIDEYEIEVHNSNLGSLASSNDDITEDSGEAENVISEGTYLVGTDIASGEYKVTAVAGETGYLDVTNSSAPGAEIVAQDVFTSSTYITVSDGQYLTLMDCTASLV